ncbi:MAG: ROK family protein, partial [Candidatus Omnitrophica bacterium]|nr:ROK family protein [Candidatus Omnitrophota bacterium]
MSKKDRVIGIDFGATFIKLAKLDLKGKMIEKRSFKTKAFTSRDGLIKEILKETQSLIGKDKSRVLGVGVGVPGQVDYKKGLIYNLTNVKGWKRVPLKAILKKGLGLPVYVDNDANVAALGEAEWGAAVNCRNIICITLGSGVGGGIIIDGKVYHGRSYSAGEIGHICIEREGPSCNCGGRGCIEAFVGNTYIVREVVKRLKKGKRSIILKLAGGKYSNITPKVIDEASRKGDSFAKGIWKEAGSNIGIFLTSVINILNPEIIVIGGGVSKTGRVLFDAIRKTIDERAIDIFLKG